MIKVFIDGKEGTTGLKIADRLSRPDIELITLPDEKRKDPDCRRDAINSSDITFLCLPDVAAKEAVSFADEKVTIIDASTAHRTEKSWAYGFPELSAEHREKIALGNRIAVPGCHASGFLSIVYPLVKHGIIDKNYPVYCHSLTGYSGGGKKMIADYAERGEILQSPRQYGLNQNHKHLKEMKAIAGLNYEPYFSPIVADFYSGMEVTVPIISRLTDGATVEKIYDVLSSHYAGSKMVKVSKTSDRFPDGFLPADYYSGADNMEILVGGNDDRINVVSLFDNLGKGASGAAVQCLNISLGIEETAGLTIK